MSIFNNPIIVTLSCNDILVSIQSYEPKHGWSQRFYLTKEALNSQLTDHPDGSVTETDLLNVCNVARIGNSIRFRFFWLYGVYDDELHGYQQTITIPVEKVKTSLAGGRVKHLSYTPVYKDKADIFFTQTAHKAIAEADKLQRHAIKRFFRDNFNYGREEHLVVQQDEWVRGFYFFSTVSRYEGGIALHTDKVKGKDGKMYQKLYFGLHT